MASRDLNDLKGEVRAKAKTLLKRCEESGLDLLIYCTLRTIEEQAKLFRQGRSFEQIKKKAEELNTRWNRADLSELLFSVGSQYGRKVTNAGPGQSMHNYGLAFDAVPLRSGKPVWQSTKPEDKALWKLYGRLGVEVGLEWAGNWTKFREFPHMQEPGTKWRGLIKPSLQEAENV